MNEVVRFGSASGRWLLLASILGSAIAGIDATVVNVALPAIGEEFDAPFEVLQWTITAYTLTLAAFILLGGSLGDRYGRKRVFVIGVVWFAVASLLCGLAPNAGTLIAARALQGIGGALLTPGSLAMIQASFVWEDRARAIGAWSGLGGVATAIGPFLGGWLVESVSWRWIFLINVPIAAVVVVISHRHVPETRNPSATGTPDYLGGLLGAGALGGWTYALIDIPTAGPLAAPVVTAAAFGTVCTIAFFITESRLPRPMLPLGIFAVRQFSATNAVTFLIYGAFGGIFFLLVVHLQVVAGFSPLAAGIALLPVTVLMLLLSSRAGALSVRIGPRFPMAAGPAICAVAALMMMGIGEGASYWIDVLPSVVVLGLGLSLLVAPLTSTALSSVSDAQAGLASGVNNAVARAAGLLAIAVLPALAGLSGDAYTDPPVFAEGFRFAAMVCAGVLAAAAVLAAVTIRNPALPEGAERAPTPKPADAAATGAETADAGGARTARAAGAWTTGSAVTGAATLRHCAVDGPPAAVCAAVQESRHHPDD
ncbi:MFS transporter [Arthrobacter sp. MSA 4-2]|uniref:MFS transporter n=1 Tax=Arthrobacter sp. MSA 4-2 TaxID=2794349 RepID=UPI0018E6E5D2|nr:MFS transporter [Arthrobacter sp. MSA 4-2]MBJ2122088.1 MFS transporter [Arthrobacter sp. MSA 4-2]